MLEVEFIADKVKDQIALNCGRFACVHALIAVVFSRRCGGKLRGLEALW